MASTGPENVGIKAMTMYFPGRCVDQSELEVHDGVASGKYTIGLGQAKMSFVDDREDIYSFALTAVSALLKQYDISPTSIGRLEVGTETLLDKSKSVKSVLMQLFEPSGNTEIEGVDTMNACYGGTNALLNAVNWIESRGWDGRDAIVVAGDIAIYERGPARPTGGAGVVAMLIGPDAPIVMETGRRASYMAHMYDFYKPDLASEYPVVNGHFSLRCYTQALDVCFGRYRDRALPRGESNGHGDPSSANSMANGNMANGHTMVNGNAVSNGVHHSNGTHTNGTHTNGTHLSNGDSEDASLGDVFLREEFDFMCFHSPNCKLVTKSYARLLYNDYVADPTRPLFDSVPATLHDISYEESLTNRAIEKCFMELSKKDLEKRVRPGMTAANMCGNMYTASLYSGLASLLCNMPSHELLGKRIGMFSYGSGLASTLFSFRVVGDVSALSKVLDMPARLEARTVVSPEDFERALSFREAAHLKKDIKPVGDVSCLGKGTYYLTSIDDQFRRSYDVMH